MAVPDMVDRAMASVVSVWTTQSPPSLLDADELRALGATPAIHAGGSGVLLSADGLVVTSAHVVEGATSLAVTFADGRERAAALVGIDPDSDLAVVRVQRPPRGLVAIDFGNSSRLRSGETVYVLGNPFGVGPSVSKGVVSATARTDLGIALYESFIQTDASMNPGSSGGAVIDERGALVGIATANLSPSGGDDGIGWAIPANGARVIVDSLVQSGRVDRGWLGVEVQALSAELADAFELGDTRGVVVVEVVAGSPAAVAGVQRGDIVERVDGAPTPSPGALRNAVATLPPGRTVSVEMMHGGVRQVLYVELAPRPGAATAADDAPAVEDERRLGLALAPLETAARQRRRLAGGVQVRAVEPDSRASLAGLRRGDVIVGLGAASTAVPAPEQLRTALASADRATALLIWRDGEYAYVSVPGR